MADPLQVRAIVGGELVECNCGQGLAVEGDLHATDCPFPGGACEDCGAPTDRRLCVTCFDLMKAQREARRVN